MLFRSATLAPLYQTGAISVNSNNVFVTLKTNPTFTFNSPTDMQTFIKAVFPGGQRASVYCNQMASPNLDTFNCLHLFPQGVPTSKFNINYSYNYQGKTGAATVSIDPLTASNNRFVRSRD